MEQTKALQELREAADLVGMMEDLINPNRIETLSPSSWAGMRLTLHSIRRAIMTSHSTLAKGMIARATSTRPEEKRAVAQSDSAANGASEVDGVSLGGLSKKNLRSSIEKFVDGQG
jgi:hypothetical protein